MARGKTKIANNVTTYNFLNPDSRTDLQLNKKTKQWQQVGTYDYNKHNRKVVEQIAKDVKEMKKEVERQQKELEEKVPFKMEKFKEVQAVIKVDQLENRAIDEINQKARQESRKKQEE